MSCPVRLVPLSGGDKRYFEVNEKAWEVLVFKGRKRIPIKRSLVLKPEFFAFFKKAYER
jgi:hypothetical protein